MNKKLKSRKLWFVAAWNLFVVFGFIVTVVLKKDITYMGNIITFAGTITAAYVGIQGYADAKK